jgi:hypothetical protein
MNAISTIALHIQRIQALNQRRVLLTVIEHVKQDQTVLTGITTRKKRNAITSMPPMLDGVGTIAVDLDTSVRLMTRIIFLITLCDLFL